MKFKMFFAYYFSSSYLKYNSHREVGGDISHGSVDRGFMDVRAGTMPNGAFFPSHITNDEIASSVSEGEL